jgi:hypothetical protein
VKIILHPELSDYQIDLLLRYADPTYRLSRGEWPDFLRAIDLLALSGVKWGEQSYSFRGFYTAFVDKVYATTFLAELVGLQDLTTGSGLIRAYSDHIKADLATLGLKTKGTLEERCLLVFCLYWWTSFGKGYLYEVEIFRDLDEAGITFVPHDLLQEGERFSPYDLAVCGLRGDVKTSTYFLQIVPAVEQYVDFYITRLYHVEQRQWRRVVIMTLKGWQVIDGATVPAPFERILERFPAVVEFTVHGQSFVAVEYSHWKEKVRAWQSQEEKKKNAP